jgi:hypothetical protein
MATAQLTQTAPKQAPSVNAPERLATFLAHLARMSVEERVRGARHGSFDRWERAVWAARFPEQVPLVNGEFEWIALAMADLD